MEAALMNRPDMNRFDENMHCSFCRKGQHLVAKLISSSSGAPRSYICDECIAVCNSILAEGPGDRQPVRHGIRDTVRRWIHRIFGQQRKTMLPVTEAAQPSN
jgi:ATP-dependent protease Clp ATPase subunit